MNIFINGRFLSQITTGVQRYALEVLKALEQLVSESSGHGVEITVLMPKNAKVPEAFSRMHFRRVGFLTGHMSEQLELPLYVGKSMLINLCNTGPIFKHHQIVTIHDAATFANPDNFSFLFRTWYRILL